MRVRVDSRGPLDLDSNLPEVVKALVEVYGRMCGQRGLPSTRIQVPSIPLSLNHQYEHTTQFTKAGSPGAFQDAAGRWRRKGKKLKPQVEAWRLEVMSMVNQSRSRWKPTGVTAAIVLFESPFWLTQRREVRVDDVDNKVKPTLDAARDAYHVPDELHWHLHAFKVLSAHSRTTIFLYDLGDVVDYFT